MPLVALFKCAMVISSSTLRPYAYPEPEPDQTDGPGTKVRERRFALDKCRTLANNHAALKPKTMGLISTSVKRVFFWTYPRTSWQWDVLCVLILVFIFLTPKSWFENTAFQRSHAAQTTVVISTDVVVNQSDRGEIGRLAKQAAGRSDAQVLAVRERRDGSGKLTAYEVDIR